MTIGERPLAYNARARNDAVRIDAQHSHVFQLAGGAGATAFGHNHSGYARD